MKVLFCAQYFGPSTYTCQIVRNYRETTIPQLPKKGFRVDWQKKMNREIQKNGYVEVICEAEFNGHGETEYLHFYPITTGNKNKKRKRKSFIHLQLKKNRKYVRRLLICIFYMIIKNDFNLILWLKIVIRVI